MQVLNRIEKLNMSRFQTTFQDLKFRERDKKNNSYVYYYFDGFGLFQDHLGLCDVVCVASQPGASPHRHHLL